MGAKIIDRGRGPEIEGTRITVYDVPGRAAGYPNGSPTDPDERN
jgi:hypothetical protein